MLCLPVAYNIMTGMIYTAFFHVKHHKGFGGFITPALPITAGFIVFSEAGVVING